MNENIIFLRELTASPGMVITNGEIYGTPTLYLGINEDKDNFYEITEEEYQEIMRQQEEALNNILSEGEV